MEKFKSYVVEVAKYDYRVDNSNKELTENGVEPYEDFRIMGIYDTKEKAEERFTNLRDAQIEKWQNEGAFETNTTPYNPLRKIDQHLVDLYGGMFMSLAPNLSYVEHSEGEWRILANDTNEYWMCRCDNDMEYRIRIREYYR